MPKPSDLFLSPDLSEEEARALLRSLGFRDAEATDRHLQEMANDVVIREALGRIAGELLPALADAPDPDAAVVGLSQYLAARSGRAMFLDYLVDDPRAMDVLSRVFGSSPMLSEILIHNPEYFHWLVSQIERSAPDRRDLDDDLEAMLSPSNTRGEALEVLRRWKWRETLRVGTCDLLRRETVPSISRQLSDLADVIVSRVLMLAAPPPSAGGAPGTLAVIALGQLGGREMGYGSAIDLVCVFDAPADSEGSAHRYFQAQSANLTRLLCGDAGDSLYRTADASVYSLRESRDHIAARTDARDRRRLLKARPVAGDADLGRRFLETVRPLVFAGTRGGTSVPAAAPDAGVGPDAAEMTERVEACVQALQLAHGARHPAVQLAGTLEALNTLAAEGVITVADSRELAHAYEFLKAVVHRRQLMPDDSGAAAENIEKQVRAYNDTVDEICRRL